MQVYSHTHPYNWHCAHNNDCISVLGDKCWARILRDHMGNFFPYIFHPLYIVFVQGRERKKDVRKVDDCIEHKERERNDEDKVIKFLKSSNNQL